MEIGSNQLQKFIDYSKSDVTDENVDPLKLSTIDYIVFFMSLWFISISLLLIFKHRKDDQFLYRSPQLVIITFSAALIWHLITGFSMAFNKTNFVYSCIAGHISQYVFYPVFSFSYIARALRLIILFKRAEKGLYFPESEKEYQNEEASTLAILRNTSGNLMEYDCSYHGSDIQKPQSKNIFARVYFWLLFNLESEFSYWVLVMVLLLFPISLAIVFVSVGNLTTLPIVNHSHCIYIMEDKKIYEDTLIDIILRSFEWYIIATIFVLLVPIRKDFR